MQDAVMQLRQEQENLRQLFATLKPQHSEFGTLSNPSADTDAHARVAKLEEECVALRAHNTHLEECIVQLRQNHEIEMAKLRVGLSEMQRKCTALEQKHDQFYQLLLDSTLRQSERLKELSQLSK